MKKLIAAGTTAAAVITLLLAGPATAATPATSTIHVPSDFVPALSDTRTTGHYEVVGTGLRVFTEGSTRTDKVAEYVATTTPLTAALDTALEVHGNGVGTVPPGAQLVVDFDGDGSADGILVGEKVYSGDWWLSNSAKQFVKDGAPVVGAGSGSDYHGTLAAWSESFPKATVQAFGFSLGSGVLGDWTIDSIRFAGTSRTFAKDVVLTSKGQCKDGGWATSTKPVYRNQGDCVSDFARR